jgi:hypothetical protein
VSGFVLDSQEIGALGWQQPSLGLKTVPDPAANAGFTSAMEGTEDTIVMACSFRLVTDANVANRIVVFQWLDSNGTAVFPVAAPYTQAASKTTDYTFAVGIQQFGANDAANIGTGIPPLKLYVGLSVAVTITAKQAGDQVSRIRLGLAQWPVRP